MRLVAVLVCVVRRAAGGGRRAASTNLRPGPAPVRRSHQARAPPVANRTGAPTPTPRPRARARARRRARAAPRAARPPPHARPWTSGTRTCECGRGATSTWSSLRTCPSTSSGLSTTASSPSWWTGLGTAGTHSATPRQLACRHLAVAWSCAACERKYSLPPFVCLSQTHTHSRPLSLPLLLTPRGLLCLAAWCCRPATANWKRAALKAKYGDLPFNTGTSYEHGTVNGGYVPKGATQ